MKPKLLTGIQSLRDIQQEWNSLWDRSSVAYPGSRAQVIALWLDQFQPNDTFHMATVWDQNHLLAAMPIVEYKKSGLTIWALPNSCWASSGELLLDQSHPAEVLCEHLVTAVGHGKWSLFKLQDVISDSTRWTRFLRALKSAKFKFRESAGDSIALTDVLQDWPAYQASWSSNHRHAVKKGIRRLKDLGDLQVECFKEGSKEELNSRLSECFQLEDRSWKGENGSSIVKRCLQSYFLGEAASLLESGLLHLWSLKLDGKLIAFEYCPVAKNVVFSFKISFDPEFSRYSPGNVLRFFQHEHYQQDQQTRMFDMLGVTCRNKAKWATQCYTTTNVTAAKGIAGNLVLSLGQVLKPPRVEASLVPDLGATRYLDTAMPNEAAPSAVLTARGCQG